MGDRQGNQGAHLRRNRMLLQPRPEFPATNFSRCSHQTIANQTVSSRSYPDDAEAFVATLAVAKFHGVGPKTAVKMRALGIETGADLRRQTLSFLQDHFGKAGSWYYDIARGRDDRSVQPDRERKSSGSETTFPEDLADPVQIEAGVIGMADDVWAWCQKANARGRTVTVKIKWADFQISTRSRSMESAIQTREKLHQVASDLIRSVFPPPKGVRLVGVTLSNFRSQSAGEAAELPFREI